MDVLREQMVVAGGHERGIESVMKVKYLLAMEMDERARRRNAVGNSNTHLA
jgi:hypothetical protein